MMHLRLTSLIAVCLLVGLMGVPGVGAATPSRLPTAVPSAKTPEGAMSRALGRADAPNSAQGVVADNFELVGHTDLGATDINGDVWVHEDFAYVGTSDEPCNGLGIKVIDVSDPANPTMTGRVAGIRGTSAEDVVVRRVSTPSFTGDLLAAGIQRCGKSPLDDAGFGVDLWDVTNPLRPVHLRHVGISVDNGVHELDMVQRGRKAYVLATTPFDEWDDPIAPAFWVVDVTTPLKAAIVGEWGAAKEGLSPGTFFGQGNFAAMFGHSARASADGRTAYVSYWDLGVVALDISDPTEPTFVRHMVFPADAEGNAHSVVPYSVGGRDFLLQNDEDTNPRSSASVIVGGAEIGIANEDEFTPPLGLEPEGRISGRVARPAREGCARRDYEGIRTEGRIAVVKTFFSAFGSGPEPACSQLAQERIASRLGAALVLHDWISPDSAPNWWDWTGVDIPVLFTDHAVAREVVDNGRATIVAFDPSYGYLRVFDAETGEQVATFSDLPYVHDLESPLGNWSIHNTEVRGDTAYSSWYSHGVVALDLSPLAATTPGDPVMVGRFVPEEAETSPSEDWPPGIANVWGVFVRDSDGLVFASDATSGLWIVRPTGPAA